MCLTCAFISYGQNQKFDGSVVENKSDFLQATKVLDTINDNFDVFSDYFTSYDTAIQYAIKTVDWAEDDGTIDDVIWSKFNLLRIYFTASLHDKAIALSNELLAYPEIKNSMLSARILFGLKEVYRKTEKFDDFLRTLSDYYDTCKNVGYPVDGGDVYESEVAYVHYRLHNFERAVVSYKIAAQKYRDKGLLLLQSSSLNNIGLCFKNMSLKDSAHTYFNKGFDVIDELQATLKRREPYVNYFQNVLETNAMATAPSVNDSRLLALYKSEVKEAKRFNELNIVIDAYNGLTELSLKKKEAKDALRYADSATKYLRIYAYPKALTELLQFRVRAHLMDSDLEAANKYFSMYHRYSDSLNNAKIQKSFMSGILKYETDIKEQELEEAKKRVLTEKRINLYQKMGLFGLFLLFVISVIIFIKMRKDNRTISKQKIMVDRALVENKILVKEVHHRVKNNLQVVSGLLLVNAKKDKDLNFEEVLAQSQQQIQSMSLIHEMLYQKEDIIDISIQEYLQKLSASILTAYPNKQIKVIVLAEGITLHLDYANPIGLIVNELMTNSIKHGFKDSDIGEIVISVDLSDGIYTIVYSDNGVGMKLNKGDLKVSKTFGSRLIRSLAEEMNATVDVSNGSKLTYTFRFSNKHGVI